MILCGYFNVNATSGSELATNNSKLQQVKHFLFGPGNFWIFNWAWNSLNWKKKKLFTSVRGRDSVTKSAVGVFISTFWTVASKNLWMFYCDSGGRGVPSISAVSHGRGGQLGLWSWGQTLWLSTWRSRQRDPNHFIFFNIRMWQSDDLLFVRRLTPRKSPVLFKTSKLWEEKKKETPGFWFSFPAAEAKRRARKLKTKRRAM